MPAGVGPRGKFVEMGAGTGHMTRLFLERGFSGACHDLGDDSRQTMRANLAFAGDRIRVVDDLDDLEPASFDFLFAFEVLEHVEADADVFQQWTRYLRPGGRVLVSVPAHQRKYGRSDEIVGHVRRYEKRDLVGLLESSGMEQIRVVNYGFPITELTRRLSNWLIRNEHSYDGMSAEQRSIRSAQQKPRVINRVLGHVNDKVILPFVAVQRWFYGRDWGDGYVASGVKRPG